MLLCPGHSSWQQQHAAIGADQLLILLFRSAKSLQHGLKAQREQLYNDFMMLMLLVFCFATKREL